MVYNGGSTVVVLLGLFLEYSNILFVLGIFDSLGFRIFVLALQIRERYTMIHSVRCNRFCQSGTLVAYVFEWLANDVLFVFHISRLPDASPIHTMGKKCQMNDVPDPPLPARPAPDVDVVSKQVSALLIVSYYC